MKWWKIFILIVLVILIVLLLLVQFHACDGVFAEGADIMPLETPNNAESTNLKRIQLFIDGMSINGFNILTYSNGGQYTPYYPVFLNLYRAGNSLLSSMYIDLRLKDGTSLAMPSDQLFFQTSYPEDGALTVANNSNGSFYWENFERSTPYKTARIIVYKYGTDEIISNIISTDVSNDSNLRIMLSTFTEDVSINAYYSTTNVVPEIPEIPETPTPSEPEFSSTIVNKITFTMPNNLTVYAAEFGTTTSNLNQFSKLELFDWQIDGELTSVGYVLDFRGIGNISYPPMASRFLSGNADGKAITNNTNWHITYLNGEEFNTIDRAELKILPLDGSTPYLTREYSKTQLQDIAQCQLSLNEINTATSGNRCNIYIQYFISSATVLSYPAVVQITDTSIAELTSVGRFTVTNNTYVGSYIDNLTFRTTPTLSYDVAAYEFRFADSDANVLATYLYAKNYGNILATVKFPPDSRITQIFIVPIFTPVRNIGEIYTNAIYNQVYEEVQTSVYAQGFDQGYNSAIQELGGEGYQTSFIASLFKILEIEIFPNFTIGTIATITIAFGLLFFILKMVRG